MSVAGQVGQVTDRFPEAGVGGFNMPKRKAKKPGASFRNYEREQHNQQRCPICGEIRGVSRGVFVKHYNNGGRLVYPGTGQECAGSGQRAATLRGTAAELFVKFES